MVFQKFNFLNVIFLLESHGSKLSFEIYGPVVSLRTCFTSAIQTPTPDVLIVKSACFCDPFLTQDIESLGRACNKKIRNKIA
jgi:hypothetical protein